MGCLKLHTENNYTTLKVVYSAVNTNVLEKQEEKNNTAFLEVVYNAAQGGGGGTESSGWGLSFYSGVPIISSPWVEKGAAFTPGPFIVTSPGINPNTNKSDRDLIRHEVEHVATFIAMGASFPLYLSTIAIPSAINYQTGWGGEHHSFYTEKIANTFSEWFYGPFNSPTLYPSYNPKKP